jgi:alpha-mannosidase
MSTMNRRRFFQISAASFLAEKLLVEGAAIPLLAQALPRGLRRELQNNPFGPALQRLEAMITMPLTDWRTHPDNLPHPEDPSLDDSSWKAVKLHDRVDGRPVWFRRVVEIPRTMGGYDIEGKRILLALRLGFRGHGRVRVFFNGSMVEMTDSSTQQPILLSESARPGQKFVVAACAPAGEGEAGIYDASIEVDYPPEQPNPLTMLQQIMAVQATSKGFPQGQSEREAQLSAVVKALDFAALDRGDEKAFNQSLAAADVKLQPLAKWMKEFTILAVGNAHIDLAWLWPWTETVEVVRDTFGTAAELMDEYPEFIFAQSTAQDFLWLEQKYPDLFKEIQKRVKDGRWEMVGGMWCEPDLNMPCGESLVRQLLTGKRYFQQKFGVDVKIGWNPDSFGYSRQLPQIYKRSGVNYFVTQKMGWNDTVPLPYRLFHWEAPDGSSVLTYFPHDYVNGINPVQCAEYIGEDTSLCSGIHTQMLLYGVGDHGGGPTRQMLDAAVRWQKSPKAAFPNFKFSTAQAFFDEVESTLSKLNLPVWNNEMYLQFHRGTYTSQADSKKRMRQMERLLLNAERFSSLAMLKGRKYPQDDFEDCWRRVLFNQFHDLMAGSGIHIIYEDEAESMEFVKLTNEPILDGAVKTLAARVDTRGPGIPVVVFNPLSWERTDVTEAEVQLPQRAENVEVRDPDGHAVPSSVISRDDATNTVKVRFLARSVPSTGYRVFHIVSAIGPSHVASTLKASGLHMENEFISVEIGPKTGCVTSLINKKDGKNILRPGGQGNLLETFVNKPKQYDAWNINPNYEKSKTELLDAEEVKLVENTPVRAVVRVKKRFQNSSFVQDIRMYPEVARVDVNMHAEWHERQIMLKVAFPLDIKPENATYQIPYGTVERPAVPHVPGKPPVPFTEATEISEKHPKYDPLLAQEAEFEVCAQQWGDLSENGRGFSLLNREKYGYDTFEPGTIRLTLLRSPIDPDPHADQGFHEMTYAMYPHAGNWLEAETELRAYELNYKLIPVESVVHEGALPASHSFVQIEPKNVILSAVKKAENDDAVIFRFYEFEGKASQVRLRLPEAANGASQTNLMEKEEKTLSLEANGREVAVPIGRYEIATVKVTFKKDAGAASPPYNV